jgi:hypothetical protein
MDKNNDWVWTEDVIHKLETYDDLLAALQFVKSKIKYGGINDHDVKMVVYDIVNNAIAEAESKSNV